MKSDHLKHLLVGLMALSTFGKSHVCWAEETHSATRCEDIAGELRQIGQGQRDQIFSALAAFASDVGQNLHAYFQQWSPLEGSSQFIPRGTFTVLEKRSLESFELESKIYDLADVQTQKIEKIVGQIENCIPRQSE